MTSTMTSIDTGAVDELGNNFPEGTPVFKRRSYGSSCGSSLVSPETEEFESLEKTFKEELEQKLETVSSDDQREKSRYKPLARKLKEDEEQAAPACCMTVETAAGWGAAAALLRPLPLLERCWVRPQGMGATLLQCTPCRCSQLRRRPWRCYRLQDVSTAPTTTPLGA